MDMKMKSSTTKLYKAITPHQPGPSAEVPRMNHESRVTATVEVDFIGGQKIMPDKGRDMKGEGEGESQRELPGNHGREITTRQRPSSTEYGDHNADYEDDFEDYNEEEEQELYEGGEHELSPEYIAHFGIPESYKIRTGVLEDDDEKGESGRISRPLSLHSRGGQ